MAQISDKSVIVGVGAALTLGLGVLGFQADGNRHEALAECLKTQTKEQCKPLQESNDFLSLAGWALAGTGAVVMFMDGYKVPKPPITPSRPYMSDRRRNGEEDEPPFGGQVISN